MKQLRVAMAGAGMVSRHHLIAWSRCPLAGIVAISDPDAVRAHARAAEFGIAAVFGDTAEMLDATRPDALDVAAGHASHESLCNVAASRGIAILCQKPLAPTLEAARSIVSAVGGRARLMVHENWRHRPYYRQVRAWIEAGRIGLVRHLVLTVRGAGLVARADGTRPALERQPMLAGLDRLMIGEVLVHHLDVANWLAGPLAIVAAHVRRDVHAVAGESAATMLLEGDAGRTAVIDGDMAAPGGPARLADRLEIIGSEGSIGLDGATLTLRVAASLVDTHYDLDEAYQAGYDNAIAHFAHALAHGLPFETPADVHLEVLALVEDAYRLAGR